MEIAQADAEGFLEHHFGSRFHRACEKEGEEAEDLAERLWEEAATEAIPTMPGPFHFPASTTRLSNTRASSGSFSA